MVINLLPCFIVFQSLTTVASVFGCVPVSIRYDMRFIEFGLGFCLLWCTLRKHVWLWSGLCLLWYALYRFWSNVVWLSVCCWALWCSSLCLLWWACFINSNRTLCSCLSASVLCYVPVFICYNEWYLLSWVIPDMVLDLLSYELWVVACHIFLVLLLMSTRSRVYCYWYIFFGLQNVIG